MNSRTYGNEYHTTVICVNSYKDSVMTGRMYNPSFEGGMRFSSTMQLLLNMEGMLDKMNFPQSFLETRSFGSSRGTWKDGEADGKNLRGETATFAVKIIFRQNASWQGTVTWLEENKEESFRSALELLLLMDSAMAGTESGREGVSTA